MKRPRDANTVAHERLIRAIRGAAFFSRAEIRRWETPPPPESDWLWKALILSFATWGSSRGSEALEDPTVAEALEYASVAAQRASHRERYLRKWFEHAKFRYAPSKARYARENFDQIESMGGAEAATRQALEQRGRAAKIAFVTRFKGIGAKYGRNLWMDVCDADFRRSIAVDSRLKTIAAAVGVRMKSYEDLETFFIGVADALGITPWGLDRFLYRKYDLMLGLLGAPPANEASIWVLVVDGAARAAFRDRDEAEEAKAAYDGGTIAEVPLDPW